MRLTRRCLIAGVVEIVIFTVGFCHLGWAQEQNPVHLEILNEPDPTTGEIVVIQGDPVEAAFEVHPAADTSASDLIQLRRVGDSTSVSEEVRGESLSGTVLLDTSPPDALGELEVVYITASGIVMAVAEQTVLVVEDGSGAPDTVFVPSGGSIQSGIDAVESGGTVYLESGIYTASLVVANKQVELIGNGAFGFRRTLIVAADREAPVITFGPGGGGLIEGMVLRGGANGIRGVAENEVKPAPVQVRRMRIVNTGQGISGSFSDLDVKECTIANTDSNGIGLAHVGALHFENNMVLDANAFGLLIYNVVPLGTIEISNSTFLWNTQGGIAIVGGANDVFITDCNVGLSLASGISIWDGGYVQVFRTHIYLIFSGAIYFNNATYDNLGDALIAYHTEFVLVDDCLMENCARVGLLYDTSGGAIYRTRTQNVRFGLGTFGEPKPYYENLSNSFIGIEEDILTDGALPVPEAPPLPE